MAGSKFRTISDELLHVAEAVAEYMSDRGFVVRPERQDLGFPYCPALYCKREHTTSVIEVVAAVDKKRIKDWSAYGKSCGHDFRVYLAHPSSSVIQNSDRNQLQEHGLGILEINGATCEMRLQAQDLSINVELPELGTFSRDVRSLLGTAYEQFDNGNWREGFEAAAQALEAEARRYLKRHMRAGRILIVGKPITTASVDRMTLGGLAKAFDRIQNQNVADKQIGQTLDAINKDRIGVVHHRGRKRAEARLRQNVGRHMWAIVAAMKSVVT